MNIKALFRPICWLRGHRRPDPPVGSVYYTPDCSVCGHEYGGPWIKVKMPRRKGE